MIASDLRVNNEIQALDYIFMNTRYPHKTVIAVNRVSKGNNNDVLQLEMLISFLIESGFIFIAGSGIESEYACYPKGDKSFKIYGGISDVITVGYTISTTDIDINDVYKVADNSNYSECIDIFASWDVLYKIRGNTYVFVISNNGSTAIITGVAALYMSVYKDTRFNNYEMKKVLNNFAFKDELANMPLIRYT